MAWGINAVLRLSVVDVVGMRGRRVKIGARRMRGSERRVRRLEELHNIITHSILVVSVVLDSW